MSNRLELQEVLEDIIGNRNVYFQPPGNKKLMYPCIIYSLTRDDTRKADNINYSKDRKYEVVVADKNPDSSIYRDILDRIQYSSFDRTYVSDNLNHFVLSIYY